jgi:hypothetical protein
MENGEWKMENGARGARMDNGKLKMENVVIANPKGEAIQTGEALTLDCFAPLAMTGERCHCEPRSGEAIQTEKALTLDCFASLGNVPLARNDEGNCGLARIERGIIRENPRQSADKNTQVLAVIAVFSLNLPT